jgi:hypothetical protein
MSNQCTKDVLIEQPAIPLLHEGKSGFESEKQGAEQA